MTGFLFLRVRGHRLLLTAALLAVLLTTAALTTLAAFAGSVENAGLRHALQSGNATAASLVITSRDPGADREAAVRAARRGAQQAFDGLPVALRQFEGSGPYALPRGLQPPAGRTGEPDLTHFAAVDRSRVHLSAGHWPTAGRDGVLEVAVPEAAARQLKLSPGARVLTLADRLGGRAVRIRVSGIYRPAGRSDPVLAVGRAGRPRCAQAGRVHDVRAAARRRRGLRLGPHHPARCVLAGHRRLRRTERGPDRRAAHGREEQPAVPRRTARAQGRCHGTHLAARRARPAGAGAAGVPRDAADRLVAAGAARRVRTAAGGPSAEQ